MTGCSAFHAVKALSEWCAVMVISLGEPYLPSRLCRQAILLQRRHETLTHRITDCLPDNERKYWSRSDDVRPHQMLVQTPQKDPNPSIPRHCPDQLSSHSSRPMIPDKLGVLSQAKRNLRLVTCSSSSKLRTCLCSAVLLSTATTASSCC